MGSIGRGPELLALYRTIASAGGARGLPPLHRSSGLHPHVTLGYDRCAFAPFDILVEWIPDELLLIESEIGRGVHNPLARWPLLPPPQGVLPFAEAPPLSPPLAAGRR